jgi:RNA polymerase sigma-70 factor (ECF subfamily)
LSHKDLRISGSTLVILAVVPEILPAATSRRRAASGEFASSHDIVPFQHAPVLVASELTTARLCDREPFGPIRDYTGGTIVPTIDSRSKDDELLAIRCQLGEAAAFDDLIARWHGPLWVFVRRLTGDDDAAREILQDVWLRVIRGIPRLREGSKLRAWLFGIARRTLMDRLRDQYARTRTRDSDVDVDEIPAEAAVDEIDDLDGLERALQRLPLLEREAVTLFYLEELSLNEIAETLTVPLGTVKSRLFRGRRLLRERMTEGG